MGLLIKLLRYHVEVFAKSNILSLRIGGLLITFILVLLSGLSGWLLERLALPGSPIPQALGAIIVIISLASTLAARSLRDSALIVLKELSGNCSNERLQRARKKLSHIVGRDVSLLNEAEILRATAETVSENSVDGVFGPLFWMLIGASFWNLSLNLPGPLAIALIYKASSTLDSMIGYKHGKLQWLGTAGARLDDLLTWLPCRAVLITLPITSKKSIRELPALIKAAWRDGSKDSSPNSGISEAIFAHCADVKMGGINKYQNKTIRKPILSRNSPTASIESIKKLLKLSFRLEITWLSIIGIITLGITAITPQ